MSENMDRFKFRAIKDGRVYDGAGVMVQNGILYMATMPYPNAVFTTEKGFEVSNVEWIEIDNALQCTGKKDGDGVLVFEGDRIEFNLGKIQHRGGIVRWNNDSGSFIIDVYWILDDPFMDRKEPYESRRDEKDPPIEVLTFHAAHNIKIIGPKYGKK